LFVFSIGTFGFYFIEGNWTLLQSFYMTIITITTVGYGEIKPLSPQGQIFTIFFIILGLSTAAILASQLARQFIERNFKAIYGAGKMRKKITKLQNHFIVCGFGDIGSSMSSSLKEASIPFAVIENNPQIVEFAALQNYLVISGKATYDATLIEAGIKQARGIVICLGDDSLNMYVSLAARELNPDLLILVRGYKSDGEKRMIRAGANSVIYPLKLGGQKMAELVISEYGKNNETNHLEVTTSGIMGYSLKMYKHLKDAATTIESILSSTEAAQVLKIQRIDGTEINRPGIEAKVMKNESILLLVHDESKDDLIDEI
ncbi:MAG: potassium channel family protein, partial [Spirochaetales bacterium]|nr:potassium channel family protein [Spirochaetales bacterium]